MTWRRRLTWLEGVLLVLALGLVGFAEPPAREMDRRPSTYAPAKDLEGQVTYFMQRIKKCLDDEAQYDTHVKAVVKDANTIAVLALVLGKHDEENRFRRPAGEVILAATRLADKAADREEARLAFAALDEAIIKPGNATSLAWQSVGNIREIMQQVPLLNSSLRGAVRSKRFAAESTAERAAGLAATMAAIAQVSMFDQTYCGDDDDRDEWIELCVLLRDASKEVYDAIRRGDQDAATDALRPLMRTCEDCHEHFHH